MNQDFYTALDLLEKEKGISKEYMIEKIEAALANACRRRLVRPRWCAFRSIP